MTDPTHEDLIERARLVLRAWNRGTDLSREQIVRALNAISGTDLTEEEWANVSPWSDAEIEAFIAKLRGDQPQEEPREPAT